MKPITDEDIEIVLRNTIRDMSKEDLKSLGGEHNPFLRLTVRVSLLNAKVNEIIGFINGELTEHEEETIH